jgi:hypothetical protein
MTRLEQEELDSGKHWFNLSPVSQGGGVKKPNIKNRRYTDEAIILALQLFIDSGGDFEPVSEKYGITKGYFWMILAGNVRKHLNKPDLIDKAKASTRKLGCQNSKMKGIRSGIPAITRKLHPSSVIPLFEMYCSHNTKSIKEVGNFFGLSPNAVKSILIRNSYLEVLVPKELVTLAHQKRTRKRNP